MITTMAKQNTKKSAKGDTGFIALYYEVKSEIIPEIFQDLYKSTFKQKTPDIASYKKWKDANGVVAKEVGLLIQQGFKKKLIKYIMSKPAEISEPIMKRFFDDVKDGSYYTTLAIQELSKFLRSQPLIEVKELLDSFDKSVEVFAIERK